MALFVENVCQLEGDILIDGVSWSPVDPIIAIACSRTDEKGLEKFHILFANNEVLILLLLTLIYNRVGQYDIKLCHKLFNWRKCDGVATKWTSLSNRMD